jgi:hypothetical protein
MVAYKYQGTVLVRENLLALFSLPRVVSAVGEYTSTCPKIEVHALRGSPWRGAKLTRQWQAPPKQQN